MKLVATIMAWMAEEYLEYCLKGLVGIADEILVLEGAVQYTVSKGFPEYSTDATLDILKRYQDKGVTSIHASELGIMHQWQRALSEVRHRYGNVWMLCCDVDEIFDLAQTERFKSWLHEMPGMWGGRVYAWSFVNNFWTCFPGAGPIFLQSDPRLGFRATSERMFGGRVSLRDSRPPRVRFAPVRVCHYCKVKSYEHWMRWRKWCPHPKGLANQINAGAKVTLPDVQLQSYSGNHPRQMYDHPYMKHPPAEG